MLSRKVGLVDACHMWPLTDVHLQPSPRTQAGASQLPCTHNELHRVAECQHVVIKPPLSRHAGALGGVRSFFMDAAGIPSPSVQSVYSNPPPWISIATCRRSSSECNRAERCARLTISRAYGLIVTPARNNAFPTHSHALKSS